MIKELGFLRRDNSIVVPLKKKKTSCLEIHADIFSEINAKVLKLYILNFLQNNMERFGVSGWIV